MESSERLGRRDEQRAPESQTGTEKRKHAIKGNVFASSLKEGRLANNQLSPKITDEHVNVNSIKMRFILESLRRSLLIWVNLEVKKE